MAGSPNLREVAGDIDAYLRFLKDEEDTADVQVGAEMLASLRRRPPRAAGARAETKAPSAGSGAHRAQPAKTPPRNADEAARALAAVADKIAACTLCPLHKSRTRVVPGQGNPAPEILFVGEAPGADEDRQGLAFVGRAGQLLTRMIQAMGFAREEVFIANILKCRPPENRRPEPAEMEVCLPYLKAQIEVLRPRVIVALGNTALMGLLGLQGISKLRGKWLTFEGIDLMPTFHPSYLLRNPSSKRPVWEDLKAVLARLGREPPPPPPPRKPAG
jgi:DNA polymerase